MSKQINSHIKLHHYSKADLVHIQNEVSNLRKQTGSVMAQAMIKTLTGLLNRMV